MQSVRNKFKVDEELLRLELQSGGNLRFEDIYEPEEEERKDPSQVKQIWNQEKCQIIVEKKLFLVKFY